MLKKYSKYAEKSALARTALTQWNRLNTTVRQQVYDSTYHYLLVSYTIAQDRMVNISSMQLSSSVNATMCWNSCLHSYDIYLVRCNYELNPCSGMEVVDFPNVKV